MNLRHVKELCKFAESLGLQVDAKQRSGTHIGIRLSLPHRQSTTLIVGSSPSDHRAMLNNKAFIKRFVRQQGEKA